MENTLGRTFNRCVIALAVLLVLMTIARAAPTLTLSSPTSVVPLDSGQQSTFLVSVGGGPGPTP